MGISIIDGDPPKKSLKHSGCLRDEERIFDEVTANYEPRNQGGTQNAGQSLIIAFESKFA
jgi:hypothetical protein